MVGSDVQDVVPGWLLDTGVGPDAKLRQGDLIVFEGNESPLRKVGIIITADCDLERGKHARLVTLVPIVDTRTVLERYLLLEDCSHKRDLIELYLFKKYSINICQDRTTKLAMLRQAYTTSDIVEQNSTKMAVDFVLGTSESIAVESYVKLMADIGGKPKGDKGLRDQIRNRGDLLILPDISKLGVTGRIAWLRHIWQVGENDIALRTSEVGARPGERFGRLDSPFRYRLTQLMAQVFSDIGLPDIPDGVDDAMNEVYCNV